MDSSDPQHVTPPPLQYTRLPSAPRRPGVVTAMGIASVVLGLAAVGLNAGSLIFTARLHPLTPPRVKVTAPLPAPPPMAPATTGAPSVIPYAGECVGADG